MSKLLYVISTLIFAIGLHLLGASTKEMVGLLLVVMGTVGIVKHQLFIIGIDTKNGK